MERERERKRKRSGSEAINGMDRWLGTIGESMTSSFGGGDVDDELGRQQ